MQKKRKFVVIWFIMAWCVCFPYTGQAAPSATPSMSLYLNGTLVASVEDMVMSKNQSAMVPLRVISKVLGYKPNWQSKTKTVTLSGKGKNLSLTVNQEKAIVNKKSVTLQTPPIINEKDQMIRVPLRFISENMGVKVDKWDNKTKSVYLSTPVAQRSSSGSDDNIKPNHPDASKGDQSKNGTEARSDTSGSDAVLTEFSFTDNQLQLTLSRNVTPTMFTMDNPNRIVIDFPNTVFSDTFYEKYSTNREGQGEYAVSDHPHVERIRFSTFSSTPNTVRFVIDAKDALQGQIALNDQNSVKIELALKGNSTSGNPMSSSSTNNDSSSTSDSTDESENITNPLVKEKYTVVIDAGHGERDSGARSLNNRNEKDFTLALALKVRDLLQQENKINVVLTREDDSPLKLPERSLFANNIPADLFLSIHANSAKDKPSVTGTETYYYHNHSKTFADTIHKHLLIGTQFGDRGVRYGDLHVVRETNMPSALLEVGFLTSMNDEPQLFDEQFQWHVAANVVNGIKEYLGIL